MPRVPPRKQKGRTHNPVDDRLLLDLWKALRIQNPDLTKEAFGRIAQTNYYPAYVNARSVVRHFNRLLFAQD
jgi:hypothetical protein